MRKIIGKIRKKVESWMKLHDEIGYLGSKKGVTIGVSEEKAWATKMSANPKL